MPALSMRSIRESRAFFCLLFVALLAAPRVSGGQSPNVQKTNEIEADVSKRRPAEGANASTPAKPLAAGPATRLAIASRIAAQPLEFFPVVDPGPAARFVANGGGYSLTLGDQSLVLTTHRPLAAEAGPAKAKSAADGGIGSLPHAQRLMKSESETVEFVGASRDARIEGLNPASAYANFFIGKDPAKWRSHVTGFERVRYANLYPGIDLVYHGEGHQRLEYDLAVAPGADPGQIRLRISGDHEAQIGKDGELDLDGPEGVVRLDSPMLYQNIANGKRAIAGGFVQLAKNEFGFRTAGYDKSRPLIIDPTINLLYSTYAGGVHDDQATDLTLDSENNVYITGWAASQDFPVTANAYQPTRQNIGTYVYNVIVMKFNSSGVLLFSTFLGGSTEDQGEGVRVDQNGLVYVSGFTESSNFPVTMNALQSSYAGGGGDAFFSVISNDGSTLIYSTYLGGPGYDSIWRMIQDPSGAFWLAGGSSAAGLPATTGAYQAAPKGTDNGFIAKVTYTAADKQPLKVEALTYLGGSNDSETGSLYDISLDESGNVYVTGVTESTDYPTTANAYQKASAFTLSGGCYDSADPNSIALVSELSGDLTKLIYSTVLGGTTEDTDGYPVCNQFGHSVHPDGKGNIWAVGVVGMQNFPTTANAISTQLNGNGTAGVDLFVTELTPEKTSTTLTYSTYLGGSQFDYGPRAIWDAENNIWIIASSQSTDWPGIVQGKSLQPANGGGYDATITELNPEATKILYATYLGGSGDEDADLGRGTLAMDSNGNLYLAGGTGSANFPTTPNALQTVFASGDPSPDGYDVYFTMLGGGAIGTVGPAVGGNVGDTTMTIGGAGFESGAKCELVVGDTIIKSTSATVNSTGTSVTCRFALDGAAVGAYNVVIDNPDGSSFTKPDGFTVEAGAGPRIWLGVVGRSAVRFNTPTTFTVTYGNSGDTDAVGVPIFISVPAGSTAQLQSTLAPLPKLSDFNPNTLPTSYQSGGATVIPIFIPIIPAGGSGSVQVQVTVPSSSSTFEIDAYNWAPFAASLEDFTAAFGTHYYGESAGLELHHASLPGMPSPQLTLNPNAANDCIQDLIQLGLQIASNVVPGSKCATSAAGFFGQAVQTLIGTYSGGSTLSNGTNLGQLYAAGGQAALNCALAAAGTTPVGMAVNTALALIQGALAGANAANDCSQIAQPDNKQKKPGTGVGAEDPNDKSGPVGFGAKQYVAGGKALTYDVAFENEAKATAPAAAVIVTDQLDPARVNLSSLALGPISFGTNVINPPSGTTSYSTIYTPPNVTTYQVRVQGSLDTTKGLLTWTFQTIDPSTHLPPTDPTIGFLPPDADGVEGQGAVVFTVLPRAGQSTGTQFANKASVVFDANAPIETPTWVNTLDVTPPTSKVYSLPATERAKDGKATFKVSWAGSDNGSGIASYTVYVSDNDGPFKAWQTNTKLTSASYTGGADHSYGFYSIATDNVGNVEHAKDAAGTSTSVTPLKATLKLTASETKAPAGSAIKFTAEIGSPDKTDPEPTGTVIFYYAGNQEFGKEKLSGGKAEISTKTLPGGTREITAVYQGDSAYPKDTSNAVKETIEKIAPKVKLVSSAGTITAGGKVTFTATVTGAAGTPTGTVSFMAGTKELGAIGLKDGKAVFSTDSLKAGSESITAVYPGNEDYLKEISNAVLEKIMP
jgi:hypothetical protein